MKVIRFFSYFSTSLPWSQQCFAPLNHQKIGLEKAMYKTQSINFYTALSFSLSPFSQTKTLSPLPLPLFRPFFSLSLFLPTSSPLSLPVPLSLTLSLTTRSVKFSKSFTMICFRISKSVIKIRGFLPM